MKLELLTSQIHIKYLIHLSAYTEMFSFDKFILTP